MDLDVEVIKMREFMKRFGPMLEAFEAGVAKMHKEGKAPTMLTEHRHPEQAQEPAPPPKMEPVEGTSRPTEQQVSGDNPQGAEHSPEAMKARQDLGKEHAEFLRGRRDAAQGNKVVREQVEQEAEKTVAVEKSKEDENKSEVRREADPEASSSAKRSTTKK